MGDHVPGGGCRPRCSQRDIDGTNDDRVEGYDRANATKVDNHGQIYSHRMRSENFQALVVAHYLAEAGCSSRWRGGGRLVGVYWVVIRPRISQPDYNCSLS